MEENKKYKIIKANEETNICIISDQYLNYGISDNNLNIILPTEYMNIQFCTDDDNNILLTKKDEKGYPKYGIADKNGNIIIEPIYGSIRHSSIKGKYELIADTFNRDEKIIADMETGAIEKGKSTMNTQNKNDETINNEYYNKGVEYINNKDYVKAYQCFERALDIEPNNEYYKVLQLKCKYEYYSNQDDLERKDLEKFIEECSVFLSSSKGNYDISVFFWRGFAAYVLDYYDDAIRDFNRVIEIQPNVEAFSYLGDIYYCKERYNKAVEYYDKAIEADPNYPRAYRSRGNAKYFLNLPIEESVRECLKAYELDNKYILALESTIIYLILTKDYYKAKHYCDELEEKSPDDTDLVFVFRGILNYYSDNKELALKCLKIGYDAADNLIDYCSSRIKSLKGMAELTEENNYINEKIESETSIVETLKLLLTELHKETKICSFCGKIETENRIIVNKDDKFICDECLELCNDILKEDNVSMDYMTIKHSENSKSDAVCSFCGRTDKEVAKIIHADKYYICNGCVGVFNKVLKNHSDFDSEYKKVIDIMKEDHGSFYTTDKTADSSYLKNKTLFIYGKELAYKYLLRAAHILKKRNCNKKDRQRIIGFLHRSSEYYINSAVNVDFEFNKPEMERLITVGMEVAFHRIVVMYKNNILNIQSDAEEIVDTLAAMVCAVELNYIKDKDRLKDTYFIANTIYFNELRDSLKEWYEDGKITKEQFSHVLDKSSLEYLMPEITRLMKSGVFNFSKIGYMILFIVIWVIFKLVIFYTRHHG